MSWNSPEVFGRNRARAGYDRRHILQMAYVYELPFGKGKKCANSGPASWIIGNWALNGVFFAMTGTPFTVGGGPACDCPGNTQTAMQVKPEVEIFGAVGPGQKWFDPTAFSADPAIHPLRTFGNSGRNIISGPGRIGTDVSLHRVFPIGERFRFELQR